MMFLWIAATATSSEAELSFGLWARTHGRRYATSDEYASRLANFVATGARLRIATVSNPSAEWGFDEYADWSDEELAGLRGGALDTAGARPQPAFPAEEGVPKPIDWVKKGAVNTPVSQGRCGTCAQVCTAGFAPVTPDYA